MIEITMIDNKVIRFKEFGDYDYDRKFFIVKKEDGSWIGIINLEYIKSIIVEDAADTI